MTKKDLLENSIVKISKQAGLEMSGTFHLTPVSRDPGGLFIMEVMRPGKKRLCEAIRRVVTGFPRDTESSCIVLLPQVVDEIILAAQSGPAIRKSRAGIHANDRIPSSSCNRAR